MTAKRVTLLLSPVTMSHQFDEKANAGSAHWETAPIALPSDRGLHVRPDKAEDAPQVCEESSPTTSIVPDAMNATNSSPTEPVSETTNENLGKPSGAPLVCGLRRRTFWFVTIILLIVIAGAAIGGAVGGVYGSRNHEPNRSPSTTSSPGLITTITSSSSANPTTSTTKAHNDFSLQIWSLPSFTGRTQLFYTPGSFQTAFLARSYIWRPGQYDLDTMSVCSVALCLGSSQLGWWGSSSREQPGYPQNETWGADNAVIDCAASFLAPPCPGPMAFETFKTAPVLESATGSLTLSVSVNGSGSVTTTMTEGGSGTAPGVSAVLSTTSSI